MNPPGRFRSRNRPRFEYLERRDLLAASVPGTFGDLTPVGDTIYFSHHTDATGLELFRSEPGARVKRLVHDLTPGPESSWVDDLHRVGDQVAFLTGIGDHKTQLWITDGTTSGLRMLEEFESSEQLRSVEIYDSFDSAVVIRQSLFIEDKFLSLTTIHPASGDDGFSFAEPTSGSSFSLVTGKDFAVYIDEQDTGDRVYVTDGTSDGTRHLTELDGLFRDDGFRLHLSADTPNESVGLHLRSLDGETEFYAVVGKRDGELNTRVVLGDSEDNGSFRFFEAGRNDVISDGDERVWVLDDFLEAEPLVTDSQLVPFATGVSSVGTDFVQLGEDHFFSVFEQNTDSKRHLYRRDGSTKAVERLSELPPYDRSYDLHAAGDWLVYAADDEGQGDEGQGTRFIAYHRLTESHLEINIDRPASVVATSPSRLVYRIESIDGVELRLIDLDASGSDPKILATIQQTNPVTDIEQIFTRSYGQFLQLVLRRQTETEWVHWDLQSGELKTILKSQHHPSLLSGISLSSPWIKTAGDSGLVQLPGSRFAGGANLYHIDSQEKQFFPEHFITAVSEDAVWGVDLDAERLMRYRPDIGDTTWFEVSVNAFVVYESGLIIRDGLRILRTFDHSDDLEVVTEDITTAQRSPHGPNFPNTGLDTGLDTSNRLIYRSGTSFFASDGTPQGTVLIDTLPDLIKRFDPSGEKGLFLDRWRISNGALSLSLTTRNHPQTTFLFVERDGVDGLQRYPIQEFPRDRVYVSSLLPQRVQDRWYFQNGNSPDPFVWLDSSESANPSKALQYGTNRSRTQLVFGEFIAANDLFHSDLLMSQRGSVDTVSLFETLGIDVQSLDRTLGAYWIGNDSDGLLFAVTKSSSASEPRQTKIYRWDGTADGLEEVIALSQALREASGLSISITSNQYSWFYQASSISPIVQLPKSAQRFVTPHEPRLIEIKGTHIEIPRPDDPALKFELSPHEPFEISSAIITSELTLRFMADENQSNNRITIDVADNATVELTGNRSVERLSLTVNESGVELSLDGQIVELVGQGIHVTDRLGAASHQLLANGTAIELSVFAYDDETKVTLNSDGNPGAQFSLRSKDLDIRPGLSVQEIDLDGDSNANGRVNIVQPIRHGDQTALRVGNGFTDLEKRVQLGRSVTEARKGNFELSVDHSTRPRQNPFNRLDANGDGDVTVRDALFVINQIGERDAGAVVAPSLQGEFTDVNGDLNLSPIDALMIINEIEVMASSLDKSSRRSSALIESDDAFTEDEEKEWFSELPLIPPSGNPNF